MRSVSWSGTAAGGAQTGGPGDAVATEDVYGEILDLAERLGAINLAQGYPEDAPIPTMLDAAAAALRDGDSRYGPFAGLPALRSALAARATRRGLSYGAEDEITVTAGCTEALVAALLAAVPPDSEILTLEPYYDSYPALARLARSRLVAVPIANLGGAVELDVAALRAAVTPATRALLLNTPHNPTGLTLSRSEVAAVADLAREHDLVVVTDEVYEECTYDREHVRLAALDGMRERTIVCSSASKMLSAGGWRVGWAYAPRHLTEALREQHRVLTFSTQTPLQAGVAEALEWADGSGYFDRLRDEYRLRRDTLAEGLAAAGLDVVAPPGGYFVVADVRRWTGGGDVVSFARRLAHEAGVAALPMTDFFATRAAADRLLRFAFCKPPEVIAEAVTRLRHWSSARDGS